MPAILVACSSAQKTAEVVDDLLVRPYAASTPIAGSGNNTVYDKSNNESRAVGELIHQAVSAVANSGDKPEEQLVSIRCVVEQPADSAIPLPCPRVEFLVEDVGRRQTQSLLTENGGFRFTAMPGHTYRLHLDSKNYEWKGKVQSGPFKGGERVLVRIQKRQATY